MTNQTLFCGECGKELRPNVHACQGCLGTVVNGATEHELRTAHNMHFMYWAGASAVVQTMLPGMLSAKLGLSIPAGFGLGIYGVAVMIIVGLYGGARARARVAEEHRGEVRTFRRRDA